MTKIITALLAALSINLLSSATFAANLTVTVKINAGKAPYTVALKKNGKTTGTASGTGSQKVLISNAQGNEVCISFKGGYKVQAPNGKKLTVVCNGFNGGLVYTWGHNNIVPN